MRKLHVVGLALFAMLVLGAFGATSASAGEWLEAGKPITVKAATDSESTLKLKSSGGVEVECEGEDAGTVGPGAADEVTSIELLGKGGKVISCKLLQPGSINCEEPTKAEALGLPWVTELNLEANGEILDLIEGHVGGVSPGWKTECTIGSIFKLAQECSKADTLVGTANKVNGTVDVEFLATEIATCKTNNETATVAGIDTILLTNGAALSVS